MGSGIAVFDQAKRDLSSMDCPRKYKGGIRAKGIGNGRGTVIKD